MDILAGDHSSPAFFGFRSFSLDVYYIDSSPREPRFVLVPLRFAVEAWPRAGLGEPRSASNANKPASSWPLKQGRKKCSKHGCGRGTSTVASGLGTHKEKKVCVDIHVQAAGSQICLQNICGQQRNSLMADPIFGSKYGCLFWTDVVDTLPRSGLVGWCLESVFFADEHSYNFYPAPAVNLGIDREGTAKSQDGQQKGTLAHVKRKVATALSMKVKPV